MYTSKSLYTATVIDHFLMHLPGTFDELLSSSEELGNSRFLVTFSFVLLREETINHVFDLNLTRSISNTHFVCVHVVKFN